MIHQKSFFPIKKDLLLTHLLYLTFFSGDRTAYGMFRKGQGTATLDPQRHVRLDPISATFCGT